MHSHKIILKGREEAKARDEARNSTSLDEMSGRDGFVHLSVLEAKAAREVKGMEDRKENYVDFYHKYNHLTGGEVQEPRINIGQPKPAWCMVFECTTKEEDGSVEVPTECVDICSRLWAADFQLKLHMGAQAEELFVLISAAYEILVEEANVVRPMMRLKKVKGSAPFTSDLVPHYTPDLYAHDRSTATCFTSGIRQRLVWNRLTRVAGLDLEDLDGLLPRDKCREYLRHDLAKNKVIRAKRCQELLVTHGGFRPNTREVLGEEVEMLAEQVLADPFFAVKPKHVLSRRELEVQHAEEEHMRARGLPVPDYEQVSKVVDILDEYCSKEPGFSENYVGSLKFYFALHNKDELEYLQHSWAPFEMMRPRKMEGKIKEGKDSLSYFKEPMHTLHWSTFYVPVDSVRDYFGDAVGLYAEWLSLYTRMLVWPAILGLAVWMYGELGEGRRSIDDNQLVLPYSIYLCIWSAVFISMWKRRENELQFLWGSEEVEETAPVRRSFVGVLERNEETQKDTVTYENMNQKRLKVLISTAVTMGIIFAVGVSAFTAMLISFYEAPPFCDDLPAGSELVHCARCERLIPAATMSGNVSMGSWIDEPTGNVSTSASTSTLVSVDGLFSKYECEVSGQNEHGTNVWNNGYPEGTSVIDQNKWKWLSALLNTVMIVVFGHIYESIAVSLNEWENHRTQIEYEDNLILKNFMFQFVNNYFVLFYIAYMRQVEVPGVDVDSECKSGSCLTNLQIQVGVVFTTKTFSAQLLEVIGPPIKQKVKMLIIQTKLDKIQQQMLKLNTDLQQAMMPDALEKFVGIDEETVLRQQAIERKKEAMLARFETASQLENLQKMTGEVPEESLGADAEAQSYSEPYTSTFDDFNEMAIQFGYLVLFSPAYPLAPLLALLNNILEMRVDATKLCHGVRRPRWELSEDIGSWSAVLSILGFAAVMTNATMVTFVGKKLSEDGWALYEDEPVDGMSARMQNYKLWALAMAIEHGIMLVRVLVLVGFPTKPSWIDDASDVLAHVLKNLKPATVIEAERKIRTEYKAKTRSAFNEAHGSDGDEQDTDEEELQLHEVVSIRAHMLKTRERIAQQQASKMVQNPMQNPMLEDEGAYIELSETGDTALVAPSSDQSPSARQSKLAKNTAKAEQKRLEASKSPKKSPKGSKSPKTPRGSKKKGVAVEHSNPMLAAGLLDDDDDDNEAED